MKKWMLLFILWVGLSSAQNENIKHDFPKIQSSVNLPIRIHLSEISSMINESVKGLIFEDKSFEDNNNDQSKVKVWKNGEIKIYGGKNQNLIIKVPLKIWAKKGIGTLGVYSYQETTFQTEMYFSTEITVKEDWRVELKTTPKGFKWIQKPVLDFGMVKISVTSFVAESLKKEQEKFCATIDKDTNAKLNFKEYAIQAWNQFSQPLEISQEYNTWLKITPLKLNVTPLTFYKNAIDLKVGLDIYSETFVGNPPLQEKAITNVENFQLTENIQDDFLLQTTANIPYSEATKLAEKMFLNETYDVKGKKIKITNIDVSGENEKIIIKATTEGAINGTSIISGTPYYDELNKTIKLSETSYQLKTKNILQKALAFLFKGKIIKKIENEYGIPTQDIVTEAEKSLTENFNKEHYKGIKTVGQIIQLTPSDVILTQNGITTIIDVKAKLNLIIKGM